ncbi:hypothetical protein [Aquifex aeolicus]|uniref:Uncharacterized protein aq_2085 n=1 Tax=Aquifex aeolicus (strain VF5) TaxID=224324 RepID=Y2085_AQUAE|nr:hypothetical protein [Aquifex aeolicus]O67858.1 RecName: Full=Uncharacterized protein aq_2085 [Aquifex aeolicus VF5]AAC07831.1 putative protein [Aquifex aeolicus VF5]
MEEKTRKLKTLERLLIYDRLLRFALDLLTGIREELKADIDETRLIAESVLEEKEKKVVEDFILKIEELFLLKTDEVLDHIYDEYEVFNFDVTFLSAIPEEIERELERLALIDTVNTKLQLLIDILDEAFCLIPEENERIRVVLTPFRVYKELLEHAIDFNNKFKEKT